MNVVNIRDIRRTLPVSRQAISQVKAAIKQAKGQALVIIHPCYSRHEIYSPSFDQEEEDMQLVRQVIANQVQELTYKHYLQRVNNRIARTPLPLFLFIENARLIRPSGLEGAVSELLPLPEATVIIPTWCRCPAPLWEEPEPEAEYASLTQQKADWKILVGLLREMGITNLSLFGELGYMLNRGHIGCVYDAEEQLGEHFKVEVNKQLVFPEIDLTRAMINFLNRNRCWG